MSSIRNIGKHFVFKDVSWYERGDCDCCGDMFFEEYYCKEVCLLGTIKPTNEYQIPLNIAYVSGIISQRDIDEDYLTFEEVETLLKLYGITWEITDAST